MDELTDETAQGERRAYTQVLELLEKEIVKAKDNGDFDTAEVFELIRAKVKALEIKKSA
jgi:hypothetical protein